LRHILIAALVTATAIPAHGQESRTPLADAASRYARTAGATMRATAPQATASSQPNWAARHPILLGTLIGVGAGVPIGAATCTYPGSEGPCDYYTFPGNARTAGALTVGLLGAGIGAGIGALVSLAEK